MKARVKATGKVVEVKYSRQMGPDSVYRDLVIGEHYMDFELSFLPEDGTPDYWTKLEHQYAGMAMQGFCANYNDFTKGNDGTCTNVEMICENARIIAHALVEKVRYEKIPRS